MQEFIIKYWLEFAFGIVAAGALGACKYLWSLVKKQKTQQKEEVVNDIQKLMEENNNKLIQTFQVQQEKINDRLKDMDAQQKGLKNGLLSIQGRAFKAECRNLLQDDHIITLAEYENLCNDHTAYNELGGNHEGDSLFDLVKIKYHACLTNKKNEED